MNYTKHYRAAVFARRTVSMESMASESSTTKMTARRPVQILLAEDSMGDVILVRRGLEALGIPFELSVVEDGEQLLSYLVNALELDGGKSSVPTPDLVLIDLNMPKLDGFKALELIAQKEGCRELPLVVISSSSNADDVRLAYDLGAHGYIDKALGPAAFIERLQFLEHYWQRQGLLLSTGSRAKH